MRYICSDCHFRLPSITALCCHLQVIHSYNVFSTYKCVQDGCSREYNSIKVFRKHLYNKHPAHIVDNRQLQAHLEDINENVDLDVNVRPALQLICNNDQNVEIEDMHDVVCTTFDFKKAIFESSRALIAKLYACSTLNRTHVQQIIDYFTDFVFDSFATMLKSQTLSILQGIDHRQEDMQQLTEMFNAMRNIFQGLETETQRVNVLEASLSYVCPHSYRIGVAEKIIKVGGVPTLTPIEITGQYIPMKHVLKEFLELPGIFNSIMINIESLKYSDEYTNIIQSPLWQNTKDVHFKNRLVLPLFLYFDDVEPDNQTGSHAGYHSLGVLYYQIPCIPQHHLSSLENIFVSSIFLSHDRHINNGNAFRPVIEELKDLQANGILVHTASGNRQVYFCLCLLLADNLGFHSITGFTESFNAHFYCRFCKEHKETMKRQTKENVLLLRNRRNYEVDITTNNVALTGIKDLCVWNELQTYHVINNPVVDIMHDLLEGVCHYYLCAILEELIFVKRYFSLDNLNDRIQNFDYGFDIGNKLSVITYDNIRREKLKMSALEMLFFVQLFGLMIGDLVPEAEEIWQLYVCFAQILRITIAPFVNTHLNIYLATLIAEHHELYCKLLSKTLKPKHHFMVHYPRILNSVGPLIHVWSMRMEGKHRPVVKQVAKATQSRKNLPLTVAKKYSLSLSARFLSKQGFPPDIVSNSKETIITDCDNYNEFQYILPSGLENSVVVTKITICNTNYERNMVLAIQCDEDLPTFGLVR